VSGGGAVPSYNFAAALSGGERGESLVSKLRRFKALLDQGTLTREEFNTAKKLALEA
jgi:hypothetical protein